MKVWIVDNDSSGDRKAFATPEAAMIWCGDGDENGLNLGDEIVWQEVDFAHVFDSHSGMAPRTYVGSIWGMEVRQ